MRKLILGIVAILAVHIAFVAFFATLDTVETARNEGSLNRSIAAPATSPSVPVDDVVIARGTSTETPPETPATATRQVFKSKTISAVERRTAAVRPPVIKRYKPQPKRTVPVYQTAAHRVERTEFPPKMAVAANRADSSAYPAKTKRSARVENRSFFSKVGSIAKKPYDALKAVASWLN